MTGLPPKFGAADLSNCDKEPIHVPGSIQPHGVLLALDPHTLKVRQVAGDAKGLFGVSLEELLSHGLESRLGPEALEQLKLLAGRGIGYPRPVFAIETRLEHDGHYLDAVVHTTDCELVVEFEPSPQDFRENPLPLLQSMIASVQEAPTIEGFLAAAAHAVRALTGFDRVMVYQFQPDDSGAVIAEAKADDVEPYLGLHYPASDIPKQARELYLRNWIRIIPNVTYHPSPLIPQINPCTGKPLDLSFSVLRSVSPLHLEYLRNMGVAASMSLSIVTDQKLWGLIACHHRQPRYIPQSLRSIGELFAQLISLQLTEKLAAEAQRDRLRMRGIHASLVEAMLQDADLGKALIRNSPDLMDYIPSGGVAVCCDGRTSTKGQTPTEEQIRELTAWLQAQRSEGVFITDRLSEHFSPAKAHADVASGLIALSVSRKPRDYILWFRPEEIGTVMWAGNPEKPVEVSNDGVRLSPRKSFKSWKETVRERSQPWGPRVSEAAQALRVSILETVLQHLDELMREREQVRMKQDLLMAELDHRVKNTIAIIQALVKYSAASAQSPEEATRSITDRLHAMARVHGILTQSRWEGVDLETLVLDQLAPFGGKARAKISGAKLVLRPKASLSCSLALHELATNAAKYGALSVPGGFVEIDWKTEDKAGISYLVLRWSEHGGPPVAPPERSGFGRLLLERSLAYDVDGEVTLDFNPKGLVCTAFISCEHVAEGEDRSQ